MAPIDPEVADALKAWDADEDWNGNVSLSRRSTGETWPSQAQGRAADKEAVSPVGGWCHTLSCLTARRISERSKAQTFFCACAGGPQSGSLQLSTSQPELTRPQSEQGPRRDKPASQRFSADELQCFKTRPLPSSEFDQKLQVYWQTFGELRQGLSDENWHTLPVLKGQFFQHSRFKESLGGPTEAEKARAREKAQRLLAEKKKAEDVQPLATEAFVGDASSASLIALMLPVP